MGFVRRFIEDLVFSGDTLPYWRPEHFGLQGKPFEVKVIDSEAPRTLAGCVLSNPKVSSKHARGWVLHFRAAGRNLGFHLSQVVHLALAGFQVVVFDYAGSGCSTGRTSFAGLVADGEALLKMLRKEGAEHIFLFGQGVGADAALQLLNVHPDAIVGVALESAWATRTGWVRERWGLCIGDIAAKALANVAVEPGSVLLQTQHPILLIEPEQGDFIRYKEKEAMRKAMSKNATLWQVPDAKYLGVFGTLNEDARQRDRNNRLSSFVDEAFLSIRRVVRVARAPGACARARGACVF